MAVQNFYFLINNYNLAKMMGGIIKLKSSWKLSILIMVINYPRLIGKNNLKGSWIISLHFNSPLELPN